MTDVERFWAKVIKTDTCWLWHKPGNKGYASCSVEGKQKRAHRYAYELVKGPIPDGLTIDHLCRVRHCVNPDHLEAVTNKVNILRGFNPPAINARKTTCANGHPYTPENTYSRPTTPNYRECRECRAEFSRRHKRKVRELKSKGESKDVDL